MTVSGDAIDSCTAVFLVSPAVIVEGIIRRKGRAVSLSVERPRPLTLKRISFPSRPQRIELAEVEEEGRTVGSGLRQEKVLLQSPMLTCAIMVLTARGEQDSWYSHK